VHSETNAASRTASLGSLVKGVRSEEQAVEVFERVAEADFVLEANATGVVPPTPPVTVTPPPTTTPTDSGSGGCTVNPAGNDAGLLMLLSAALLGGWLRRRTPRARKSS
jgi:hypothetical protein